MRKNKEFMEKLQVERMIHEGGIGPELSYLVGKLKRNEEENEETKELVLH